MENALPVILIVTFIVILKTIKPIFGLKDFNYPMNVKITNIPNNIYKNITHKFSICQVSYTFHLVSVGLT